MQSGVSTGTGGSVAYIDYAIPTKDRFAENHDTTHLTLSKP